MEKCCLVTRWPLPRSSTLRNVFPDEMPIQMAPVEVKRKYSITLLDSRAIASMLWYLLDSERDKGAIERI